MNSDPSAPAKPTRRRVQSLGGQATAGLFWVAVQTALLRVVGIVGQLITAWVLMPDDFALAALAMTASAFANVFQSGGLSLMIQRSARMRLWATPLLWLSLTTNAAIMLLLIAVAPLIAMAYGEPTVRDLIIITAIGLPFASVRIVPEANLRAQLRFRALACSDVSLRIIHHVLVVTLALAGLGPFSFVVPTPIMNAMRSGLYWWMAPVKIRMRLEWRRWRYLVSDSTSATLNSLTGVARRQSILAVLGLLASTASAGIYFFAENLAMQVLSIIVKRSFTVFYPILTQLRKEPARQLAAYRRVSTTLRFFISPVCLLQAILAEPLFSLVFEPGKWDQAIPIFQILSLGLILTVVEPITQQVIQAQGKFTLNLVLSLLYLPLSIGGLILSTFIGPLFAVAIAAVIMPIPLSIARWYFAVRGVRPLKQHLPVLLDASIPCGAVAALAAYALINGVAVIAGSAIAQLLIGGVVLPAIYLGAVWLISPSTVNDIIETVRTKLRKRKGKGATRAQATLSGQTIDR